MYHLRPLKHVLSFMYLVLIAQLGDSNVNQKLVKIKFRCLNQSFWVDGVE